MSCSSFGSRLQMPRVCLAFLAITLAVPATTRADGPTSSAISIVGARTLPSHSTLIAAEAGWPGAYGAIHFAAGSRLSLAVRGGVAYGSPFMSFVTGISGQLEAQGRLHLYGYDNVDVALSLAAGGAFGEGGQFGETGTFSNDVGYGGYVDPAMLASFAASRTLTLTGGVFGSIAYVTVPDRNIEPSHLLGGVGIKLAVEVLMSRDLLMFAQLTAGAGVREEGQFDNATLLRLSLGAAFLM